jgi:hypothetical protein
MLLKVERYEREQPIGKYYAKEDTNPQMDAVFVVSVCCQYALAVDLALVDEVGDVHALAVAVW